MEFKITTYKYQVFKNILFVNLSKEAMFNSLEGRIQYLNIYVDLSTNLSLNTRELLSKLNVTAEKLKDYIDVSS